MHLQYLVAGVVDECTEPCAEAAHEVVKVVQVLQCAIEVHIDGMRLAGQLDHKAYQDMKIPFNTPSHISMFLHNANGWTCTMIQYSSVDG